MDENKHNLYDKNILEFVTVAAQFCNMLENVTDFSRKDFLDKITKVLPLLYLKADLMPEYEGYEGISLEEFVDEDNYNIVRNNIALLLTEYLYPCLQSSCEVYISNVRKVLRRKTVYSRYLDTLNKFLLVCVIGIKPVYRIIEIFVSS